MKELNRIILVNWYRFDSAEIHITGNTAIVGANAAGKSSILDAVQTVLMGGDKTYVALNAGAEKRSKRTIREYALGFLSDPNSPDSVGNAIEPRKSAITYIALSFIDRRSYDETCIGMAITASLSSPEERIEGRFVVTGMSAHLDDFIERTVKGVFAKKWEQVKTDLSRRFPHMEIEAQAERFVKKYTAALSLNPAFPNDFNKLRRNLRNAISYIRMNSPDDFMRRYILDERPIQINELRAAMERYNYIKDSIAKTEKKLAELKKILASCETTHRHRRAAQDYGWAMETARIEECLGKIAPLQDEIIEATEETAALQEEIAALLKEDEKLTAELQEKEMVLRLDNTESKIAELTARRDSCQQTVAGRSVDIDRVRRTLGGAHRLGNFGDKLPLQLVVALTQAVRHLPGDDELTKTIWPERPAEVDAAIAGLKDVISANRETVIEKCNAAAGKVRVLDKEIGELHKEIKSLTCEQAVLKKETVSLVGILERHGIKPALLCDLVEVVDPVWVKAIEGYMGGLREALVVPPEKAEEAIRLYRREGRHLKGCHIVNSLQTVKWIDRAKEGSLATLVKSDNIHAQAYINRILGSVICVETETELTGKDRAITADCMLAANGSVTAMHEVACLLLGREARQRSLVARREKCQSDLDRKIEDFSSAKDEQKLCDSIRSQMEQLEGQLASVEGSLIDMADARRQAEEEAGQLSARIDELQRKRDPALRQKVEGLKERIIEVKTRAQDKGSRASDLEKQIITKKIALETLDADVKRYEADRRKIESDPYFFRPGAVDLFDRLREKHSFAFKEVIDEAIAKKSKAVTDAERGLAATSALYAEYQSIYRSMGDEVASAPPNFDEIEVFARNTIEDLEQTTLVNYKDQATRAAKDAEIAFRSDFITLLRNNFESVHEAVAELNKHLKNRVFHDERYEFKATRNPVYADIYTYVMEATREEQIYAGGLFDSASDESSPYRAAIEQINAAICGEGESRAISDYRNYFTYEVKMTNLKHQFSTDLTARLAKGSGGENQTPFYVAIGAALSATYRLRELPDGHVEGGMNLIAFDEAFNNLDVANTENCIEFLKSVHLQILLCAPDEKYALMSGSMDTLVTVTRDGGVVEFDVEYPTAAARRLLREDNPFVRPEPAEEEAAEEAGETSDELNAALPVTQEDGAFDASRQP